MINLDSQVPLYQLLYHDIFATLLGGDDGILQVATLTQFPGSSGQMIDWWFGWHGVESQRYKLWRPQAHLISQTRYHRADRIDITDRQKYIGNTSYVDEYVGRNVALLTITFQKPCTLGFNEELFEDAGIGAAVCARVGFSAEEMNHLAGFLPELYASEH